MKSIRLSLMVYFLGLLAAALGAASFIAYQTAHQTVLDKQESARQLVEKQYEERCRQEKAALDDDLLQQAQTLARLTQFQMDWTRLRHRDLQVVGLLGAAALPNAQLTAPTWIAEGVRSPFFFELHRKGLGEITLDSSDFLEQTAEYFQIDGASGGSYRSQSLAGRSLPLAAADFAPAEVLHWEWDDVLLGPDLPLRRVVLKTSARMAMHFNPKGERPPPPDFPHGGHAGGRFGDSPKNERPTPPEFLPRSAIYIQCACSTQKRDGVLQDFKKGRDDELADLNGKTDESLASLRNRLLLTSTIAFAAAVAGCFGLVRLGLSPLRRLSDAVSRVSEKDFRLPLEDRRLPGELKPIVQRLTDTLEMLKRAFEREKQATADISHELRTPLAALLTTTEIALRKPRSAEEYHELLQDCRLSAQQMSRAVERLLTLARLDAGVDRLRLEPVDAAEIADQCAALVRPLAEARGVTLAVHHGGPAPARADPDKLREVLTNLLHNAIEYNRPQGSIDVTVTRDDGRLRLEVRDTGVGISAAAQAHIFERFYREDSSRGGDDGLHAGLGLAIVKGYVDLMGGAIAVDSVVGQGSAFRVELPAE